MVKGDPDAVVPGYLKAMRTCPGPAATTAGERIGPHGYPGWPGNPDDAWSSRRLSERVDSVVGFDPR